MSASAAAGEPAPGALERYGAFLFRRRNLLFPLIMAAFVACGLAAGDGGAPRAAAYASGLVLLGAGQTLRVLVVGLAYIKRGGLNKQVYAEDLVTAGMFAHCRNPLYLGNLVVALGLLALTSSPVAMLGGMAFFASAYGAIVMVEERYLERRFGARYRRYCHRVPRWLPRLRGLLATVRSCGFDWRQVIAKEYPTLTTTVVSACAIIAARELCADQASAGLIVASAGVSLLVVLAALRARRFKKRAAVHLAGR